MSSRSSDLPRAGGGARARGRATGSWATRAGSDRWNGSAPPTDELIVAAAEAKRPILRGADRLRLRAFRDAGRARYRLPQAGGRAWRRAYIRVPTVGTDPAFIAGLARSVASARRRRRRRHRHRVPLLLGCEPLSPACWLPSKGSSPCRSIPGCTRSTSSPSSPGWPGCSICRGSTSITRAPRAGSELSETFKVMERRLLRGIINPAMIANLDSGAAAGLAGPSLGRGLVPRQAGAARLHAADPCRLCALAAPVRRGRQPPSSRNFYRAMNEVPTLLMIGIILLAVLKPF